MPSPSALLSTPDFSPPPFHPVIFDSLDEVLVRRTILRMDGAAGPFGLDGRSCALVLMMLLILSVVLFLLLLGGWLQHLLA